MPQTLGDQLAGDIDAYYDQLYTKSILCFDFITVANHKAPSPQNPKADRMPTSGTPENQPHMIPAPPNNPRASAARQRSRKRAVRGTGQDWAWVIVAGALLLIVFLIGTSMIFLLQNSTNTPNIIPTATLDVAMLPPAVDLRGRSIVSPSNAQTGDIILLNDGTPLELKAWDGTSRFTVLLMGMDRRPNAQGYAFLTDTLMLISIDPKTSNIGILSIPRDLYVQIPGYASPQRINTALALGETRSPGSGATLAMQTIQNNLGMRIHEYILVDFQTVIDLVNAVGGITVTTDYVINDRTYPDMNYGYDPFYLPAGTHNLDGTNALKFARTRHGDSDIDRAHRQQEVVMAIRDKVTSFNMLPNLIVQAPSLMASLADNVRTGLSLNEIIQLAWLVKDIPQDNITLSVIDYKYVQNYTTPRGEQVLLPYQNMLPSLLAETFGTNYGE